jgi:hypothetical protein
MAYFKGWLCYPIHPENKENKYPKPDISDPPDGTIPIYTILHNSKIALLIAENGHKKGSKLKIIP